jgi:hypothetical protein
MWVGIAEPVRLIRAHVAGTGPTKYLPIAGFLGKSEAMDQNHGSLPCSIPPGLLLAPIHASGRETPLKLGLFVVAEPEADGSPFLLLREVPGCRIYLGAVCDAAERVQEWVEVWVQDLKLRDVAFSSHQEPLDNATFDQRWRADCERTRMTLPETVIATGMEETNPSPILIKPGSAQSASQVANIEPTSWKVCKDDALLASMGLPPYSTSSYRYLYDPAAGGSKKFIAAVPDAPANSHVQSLDHALPGAEKCTVFNAHGGLVRVTRFSPLELEDYLQILEGRPWNGPVPRTAQILPGSIYSALQAWSGSPKGLPFLLHSPTASGDRLNEVFFLKLSALLQLLKGVRAYVSAQQLPLLNLSPTSFRVFLPEVGDSFPAFWASKVTLTKPGQAYLLKIKFTEQKYFVRLGRTEPSPFLPEGLGAHSFGIGSVRVRNVLTERDGVVLEGTLVAEDYLGLDAHDMLWFKLPLGEERLEFYAHVHTSETVGPKEARFRTVPAKHTESVIASLKRATGTAFQRSPYEIWPLLSSPCDMFSLGVIATRILLANSQGNLAVILDEILSLAQRFGKQPNDADSFLSQLKALAERDQHVLDLISPHGLMESGDSPEAARSKIQMEPWLETIGLLLRLFPGVSPHSFCRSFGDVSALALETVFDRPIQELEAIALRLRSALLPSLSANEDIASVLLSQLASLGTPDGS